MALAVGATKAFDTDFAWQRRFLPEVKAAVGRHLMVEGDFEEDALRNTDLMVLRMDPVRIGCRIRRHHRVDRYQHEFTVRSSRPSGVKTELDKITDGWGDYLFYGFANDDESGLCAWSFLRLNVFRSWRTNYLRDNGGNEPGTLLSNHDGSSDFRVYRISELPRDFPVAQQWFTQRGASSSV